MVAVFAPAYEGLKHKGSYETVLDAVGKAEVSEPDRRAKLFRETPQISNLLDGEGVLGMEALQKQELGAAKHRVVEATIREEAGEPTAPPAQQLRAEAASQTYKAPVRDAGLQANPTTKTTETQARPDSKDQQQQANPTTKTTETQASASTQFFAMTPEPKLFDLSPDTHESFSSVISAAIDTQSASQDVRGKKILGTIAHHMGGDVSRTQQDFAHRMAAAAAIAGASSFHPTGGDLSLTNQLREAQLASAASPEATHEPRGRPGRPRSYQPQPMEDKVAGEKILNSGPTGESPPKSKTRSKGARSKSSNRAKSTPPPSQRALKALAPTPEESKAPEITASSSAPSRATRDEFEQSSNSRPKVGAPQADRPGGLQPRADGEEAGGARGIPRAAGAGRGGLGGRQKTGRTSCSSLVGRGKHLSVHFDTPSVLRGEAS